MPAFIRICILFISYAIYYYHMRFIYIICVLFISYAFYLYHMLYIIIICFYYIFTYFLHNVIALFRRLTKINLQKYLNLKLMIIITTTMLPRFLQCTSLISTMYLPLKIITETAQNSFPSHLLHYIKLFISPLKQLKRTSLF